MKRGARMRSVVLLGLVALVAQNASAGSAVAMESHHGHLVSYHGYPVNEAKRLALETARSLYGTDVKIIAASDVAGYCAIAVARKGKGSDAAPGRLRLHLSVKPPAGCGGCSSRGRWPGG